MRRAPYEHLLGRLPDALIASLYSIGQSSIAGARNRRGIPPSTHSTICRVDWTRLDFLLGWFTDHEVARLLLLSHQSVSELRRRRGFEPRFPSGRRPSAAEKRAMVYPGPHPRGDRFEDETDPYRRAFENVHPTEGLARLARILSSEEYRTQVGEFDVATSRATGAVHLIGEAMTPDEADALAVALRTAAGMMRRITSRHRGTSP